MHKHSAEEVKAMKDTWDQVTKVEDLQQQGYTMTLLMWDEKARREDLEVMCKDYMTDNMSTMQKIDKMEMFMAKIGADAKVVNDNYNKLTESILALISKSNGSPLNNEMAQVMQLVKNSQKQMNSDKKLINETYLQRVSNLNKKYQQK